DIYKKYINKNASNRNQTFVGRLAILVFALIAGVVAIDPPGLIEWIGTISLQGINTVARLIFFALFWREITKAAAIFRKYCQFASIVRFRYEFIPKFLDFRIYAMDYC